MGCRQSLTLMKACKRTISIIVFKIMMGLWKFNYRQNTLANGDWKHVIASVSANGSLIPHQVKASLCGVMGNFLNCGCFHNCCEWQQYPSYVYCPSPLSHRTRKSPPQARWSVWPGCGKSKGPDVLPNDASDRIESLKRPFKQPLDPEVISHVLAQCLWCVSERLCRFDNYVNYAYNKRPLCPLFRLADINECPHVSIKHKNTSIFCCASQHGLCH